MKMFAIYDTENQTFFKSLRGVTLWPKAGSAKLAWSATPIWRRSMGKFDEQTRFIVREMTVLPTQSVQSLQKDADTLARLRAAGVDNWEGYHFAFGEDDE